MRLAPKYFEFDTELATALAYATANTAALGISADQLTALTDASTAWTAAFALYQTPATHTPLQVAATQTAYNTARDLLTGIQQQIKNDRSITLSDADIDNMYIHRDAQRRGRVPVPSVAPDNTLLESKHLTNQISTFQPDPGVENHRGLPTDVFAVMRKIALVAIGSPAPEADAYHAIETSGHGTFRLAWVPEQEGMECYLITAFVNRRGEMGPESQPISFTII